MPAKCADTAERLPFPALTPVGQHALVSPAGTRAVSRISHGAPVPFARDIGGHLCPAATSE